MENSASLTDSYLSILLNLPHISPLTILSFFFLAMARMIPIMFLAPFFGSKSVPAIVKIGFSLCICTIFLPQLLLSAKTPLEFGIPFIGYMLKEAFIGFILGFLATIPFYIAQSSGSLIDHIRGSSSLQVTEATTQTQTGPIGVLYNYVLIVVFFAIGGPFYFLEAIANSFELIPVNALLNPDFFSMHHPFWKLILSLMNQIFTIAIQLGAPSLIGILMTDMFLGIANRLAPQVQIVFLGMPLKSWVGLALLAAAWYFIIQQLGKDSLVWLKLLQKTIHQMAF